MNLELLDPFGRQVPDRIDSTVDLPTCLHFRKNVVEDRKSHEWKSAFHVAFNRRGTYAAVGYGSGAVGVYNMLSRNLSALFRDEQATPSQPGSGVSSVSWSRRSRTMLVGSVGESLVRLIDTTHPYGVEEGCAALPSRTDGLEDEVDPTPLANDTRVVDHTFEQRQTTSFADVDVGFRHVKESREVKTKQVEMGATLPARLLKVLGTKDVKKVPTILFRFDQNVNGSLQVNPRIPTAGLAALEDGTLVLFHVRPSLWTGDDNDSDDLFATVIPLWTNTEKHIVVVAAFDPRGTKVYAATESGHMMGFDVSSTWKVLEGDAMNVDQTIPTVEPSFCRQIPGTPSSSWHIVVSRNGKTVALNGSDGVIRVFSAEDCWNGEKTTLKTTWAFQDVVNKIKFASCDLSGDSEYLVGGANGSDHKYEVSLSIGMHDNYALLTRRLVARVEYEKWPTHGQAVRAICAALQRCVASNKIFDCCVDFRWLG